MCASNSPLSGISMTDCEVGDGKYSIKITDLERKVNINTANEVMLQQALALVGVDANDAPTIVGSILDWIDPDSSTHPDGAESDYYQGLDPPYYAKNAPIDDLSELLLVKGVTPEIFWGGVSTNHPRSAFQNRLGRPDASADMPTTSVGLVDLFTPISSGRININTASADVLQMVPMIDENVAARIIEFREQGEGFESTMPIGSPGKGIRDALLYAGLNPQVIPQIEGYFTVRSYTFEVHVDASIGDRTQQFVAILGARARETFRFLSFYPFLHAVACGSFDQCAGPCLCQVGPACRDRVAARFQKRRKKSCATWKRC